MSRKRAPERDKAMYMYVKAAGNIKLVDIAKELEVSDNQIRQWKKKDDWDNMTVDDIDMIDGKIVIKSVTNGKDNVTIKNNVINEKVTEKNDNVTDNNNDEKENIISPTMQEVKELVSNDELTDKEKLFCVIYVQKMNKTKAYQRAFKCKHETAMVQGAKLYKKPRVKEQINKMIASQCDRELLGRSIIQKYIDIAFADIGDYVDFGRDSKRMWTKDKAGNDIPVIDPETGEQKIFEYNYVHLKQSSMVDTTLISEVSEGKDGVKFKLASKEKALDFLTKHCNLLNDKEKLQLDIENKKLQNMKLQAEINKITGNDETEVESDGFLEALEGKVSEVWTDE